MYVQRLRCILLEVYKIVHTLGPSYLHDLVSVKELTYNTRKECLLIQPKYNSVKYGRNSFKYQGSKLWNSLSNDGNNCEDIKSFKNFLLKWKGPECECANCITCNVVNV